jgi:hypothetical protein
MVRVLQYKKIRRETANVKPRDAGVSGWDSWTVVAEMTDVVGVVTYAHRDS